MLLLTRMLSNHSHALHPHPLRSPLHAHTLVGRKSGIAAIAGIEEKEGKKDNKLADDEEEMMVAFLEGNEMLWDKKATLYRRPDLKTTA